jgi:hypothetical protein
MPEPTSLSSPQLDARGHALLARHRDWWQHKGLLLAESVGSPLGDLWLPLADGTLATEDVDMRPEMLDLDRLAGEALLPGPVELQGDSFDIRAPYTPVPWVEAILGCPIRATIMGGSMRTHAFIPNWEAWESRPTHRDDAWFDCLKTLIMLLAERVNGRYAVVQTLMRGPSDLAEAVLGPEMMSFAMYDHPAELRRFLEHATALFLDILYAQLERMPKIEGGQVNPFGVWAPGTVVRTQCDASAFLSPKQYQEWYLPYDERISKAVDYAVIHLHSCSLHVVGPLLTVQRPQAIQVTLETGPNVPTLEQMVPIFRKILEKKCLIADGPLTDAEVAYLLRELPHDGLYIRARKAVW